MKTNAKEFSNEEITVTYDPKVCESSGRCARELSDVFRTTVIPWVDIDGASPQRIADQVQKCPSGALKFRLKQKVA